MLKTPKSTGGSYQYRRSEVVQDSENDPSILSSLANQVVCPDRGQHNQSDDSVDNARGFTSHENNSESLSLSRQCNDLIADIKELQKPIVANYSDAHNLSINDEKGINKIHDEPDILRNENNCISLKNGIEVCIFSKLGSVTHGYNIHNALLPHIMTKPTQMTTNKNLNHIYREEGCLLKLITDTTQLNSCENIQREHLKLNGNISEKNDSHDQIKESTKSSYASMKLATISNNSTHHLCNTYDQTHGRLQDCSSLLFDTELPFDVPTNFPPPPVRKKLPSFLSRTASKFYRRPATKYGSSKRFSSSKSKVVSRVGAMRTELERRECMLDASNKFYSHINKSTSMESYGFSKQQCNSSFVGNDRNCLKYYGEQRNDKSVPSNSTPLNGFHLLKSKQYISCFGSSRNRFQNNLDENISNEQTCADYKQESFNNSAAMNNVMKSSTFQKNNFFINSYQVPIDDRKFEYDSEVGSVGNLPQIKHGAASDQLLNNKKLFESSQTNTVAEVISQRHFSTGLFQSHVIKEKIDYKTKVLHLSKSEKVSSDQPVLSGEISLQRTPENEINVSEIDTVPKPNYISMASTTSRPHQPNTNLPSCSESKDSSKSENFVDGNLYSRQHAPVNDAIQGSAMMSPNGMHVLHCEISSKTKEDTCAFKSDVLNKSQEHCDFASIPTSSNNDCLSVKSSPTDKISIKPRVSSNASDASSTSMTSQTSSGFTGPPKGLKVDATAVATTVTVCIKQFYVCSNFISL